MRYLYLDNYLQALEKMVSVMTSLCSYLDSLTAHYSTMQSTRSPPNTDAE